MQAKLRQRLEKDEWEARLINWGLWHSVDNTFRRLDYPRWYEILKKFYGIESSGLQLAELDAEHLEDIISTLDMAGRGGFGWGTLWAFVLKLEYIEGAPYRHPTLSQKAKDVSRKFCRPCSERSYQRHLYNARCAVFEFADPI
jgi:hypothetical protein